VCPDTACPGLVNDIGQILDTVTDRVKNHHSSLKYLPKATRVLENHFRALLSEAKESDSVRGILDEAISTTITELADSDNKKTLTAEFDWFREQLGEFQFALTRPYFTLPEKKDPGSGGLFSITINPYTCKGCKECIEVCPDNALEPQAQTPESIQQLRKNWKLWLDLPNTPEKFIRVENLEESIGALETILLNKDVYLAFSSGDGACMGCSEKTVLHLFIATVESLMQPRIKQHVTYLTDLINRLERYIETKLVQEINIDNPQTISKILAEAHQGDLTLADIAAKIEAQQGTQPIDRTWLQRVMQMVAKLKHLKWKYTEGVTGRGRVSMGILNSTGCSSVWGSTWPYNPYPFPWANHLFQDSPSMAMGVFEGHMSKMADGFKAIRMAEMELNGSYNPTEHDEQFRYFNWHQFSDEEFLLCPPVAVVGGDGAMYDIGFQNLSRALMSGKPLKIVVLDTQVYSNTGGQACTSGFTGQVSDMAPFGKVNPGKQEIRKEIGLIAMAHRTAYVMQSTIAYPNHMIEGFIEGLMARRPALFNCYTSCQPEHGIGDDMGHHQAKLAVESRAYPLYRYHPDHGVKPEDCFELEGNPDLSADWPTYPLQYHEGGRDKHMQLPMTFADFAITEVRFRKHFRMAPPDTWHENMVPLAEYIQLNVEEREGKFPFIWTVDRKQQLSRLLVDQTMVHSTEDRRDFWHMLKAIAGVDKEAVDTQALENKIRQEVMAKISAGLMQWISGDEQSSTAVLSPTPQTGAEAPQAHAASTGDYMAPWIDSEDCTACDECMKINSNIFAYNEDKHAYIKDPNGGPYKDLVKAAEKCTAQIIHPGLPKNRNEKDIDKWIERGKKHN
jgi:pyruvate-ferredoxin/flavodoxin oxidoreductase